MFTRHIEVNRTVMYFSHVERTAFRSQDIG